jgi:transposase-like protein
MIFTVLGAVAELERSLIVERVRAGMGNARAKGKRIGRSPRTQLTPEDRKSIAEAYWCRKASFRQLARRFDTSIGTVQRCALAHQKLFAAASIDPLAMNEGKRRKKRLWSEGAESNAGLPEYTGHRRGNLRSSCGIAVDANGLGVYDKLLPIARNRDSSVGDEQRLLAGLSGIADQRIREFA